MSEWLIETLVWTSALMLLVLAIRGPVAQRFGARVAYGLWLLPAARFFVPTFETVVEREVAAPTILPAAAAGAVSGGQESALANAYIVAAMKGEAQGTDALAPAVASMDWPLLLLTLWAIGAVATFLVYQGRYVQHRRTILGPATKVERVGGIDLMVSPAAPGPMAFGTIHRVIALPQSYADRCTDTELDLALEHELSHHRSGDLFARQFGLFILSLHWFNPIAWRAYAAFHFDQEAACDARVLARRGPSAAADYGRAIAKSAAPQKLLFANARDTCLKRRLKMMKNVAHRPSGMLIMAVLAAVILPATASRAVSVIDVAAPPAPLPAGVPMAAGAPVAPVAVGGLGIAPPAPVAPIAPVAPVAVSSAAAAAHPHAYGISINGDKNYSEMTAQERAEFDEAIEEIREAIVEVRQEREEVRIEMRQEMAEVEIDMQEMRRDLAEAIRDLDEGIADIDAEADEFRRHGQDPEVMKAGLRAAKASIQAMDIEAIVEASMSSVDPEVVTNALKGAEAGLQSALAEMEARRNR
ncbi:M56 family metallopeptidase [Sphingomicrobium arenosum]|uniref:M56 family metallopeptidase n=1 Tax=Sphingomicrobium arenosum TaxID=2233861 RepID=UPI00223F61BB|nr:M56 family metallopeptidase [Sphingomicrobium arenosum]